MSRRRVLQVVASSHGGGAVHVRELALGLPPEQFAVTVAMPPDEGQVTPQDFANSGVDFVPLPIAAGFAWPQILKLRRLLQAGRIQLLHAHGMRAGLYGRLAALACHPRPRILLTLHGFAAPFYAPPKRALYIGLERALQPLTACTICVSRAEAELFLAEGLARPDKVRVVPPGIEVSRFATPPPHLDRLRQSLAVGPGPLLLTICRLHIPRDFDTLLAAFGRAREEFPTAHLLIVGDGPRRGQVEGLISRLGLERSVTLAGLRGDVPALLALADLYVLTSYGWEGYPLSTLEAQAAGVPVVVTDAGGSGEAVLHEETGLVVPKCQPALLAQAMSRLLQDSALRRRMGQAGRQRAQAHFNKSHMVAKIVDIYRE